jgi:hypothetical protein
MPKVLDLVLSLVCSTYDLRMCVRTVAAMKQQAAFRTRRQTDTSFEKLVCTAITPYAVWLCPVRVSVCDMYREMRRNELDDEDCVTHIGQ